MNHPTTCSCVPKNTTGTCKNCSRIKMVFNLKNGYDQYKIASPTGKLINPVKYNYYKDNKQDTERIVKGMLRRFSKTTLYKHATQVIQFYENGELIYNIPL